ncbi:MAG: hypothetical protein KKA10_01945 [Euryarchaeota archaeon]|nr:hypothetical protein [Euryarchaeota archaeon]
MSNNRIILVIKASDIDVSSLPEDKRDIKSYSKMPCTTISLKITGFQGRIS